MHKYAILANDSSGEVKRGSFDDREEDEHKRNSLVEIHNMEA